MSFVKRSLVPQLYYIKMKICYDPCLIDMAVVITTEWRHYVFLPAFVFLGTWIFFRNRFRELVPPLVASFMGKIEKILWQRFGNILKRSFKCHRNSEYSCYRHNWLISKENNKSGNAVLSHSGLIPLELGKKKEGDCFGRLRERIICLYNLRWATFFTIVVCNLLHTTYTTHFRIYVVTRPPPPRTRGYPKLENGSWVALFYERKWLLVSADVRGGGTREEAHVGGYYNLDIPLCFIAALVS